MGEAALLRNIHEQPMKYVLCRENSLADMITNTRALENVEGVKSVEISLNQEVLVSAHLRHSLSGRKLCRRWKRIEWPNPASIEVPNKEKF
jgi:copper chaperone CopZ